MASPVPNASFDYDNVNLAAGEPPGCAGSGFSEQVVMLRLPRPTPPLQADPEHAGLVATLSAALRAGWRGGVEGVAGLQVGLGRR